MVSIRVLEKCVVEQKTLGWENSRESIENCHRKPWSSIYSTKMFSNGFRNMKMDLGATGVGSFLKDGIVYKFLPNQLLPCNHITPVWDGA
jgi:hypothetical protein